MRDETKFRGGRINYEEFRAVQPTDEQTKIADVAYSLCLRMATEGRKVDETVVMEILKQTHLPMELQMALLSRIGIGYGIILQGGSPI